MDPRAVMHSMADMLQRVLNGTRGYDFACTALKSLDIDELPKSASKSTTAALEAWAKRHSPAHADINADDKETSEVHGMSGAGGVHRHVAHRHAT